MIIIDRVDREKYIGALQACRDNHSMAPIVDFFFKAAIQRMEKEISMKKTVEENVNYLADY